MEDRIAQVDRIADILVCVATAGDEPPRDGLGLRDGHPLGHTAQTNDVEPPMGRGVVGKLSAFLDPKSRPPLSGCS